MVHSRGRQAVRVDVTLPAVLVEELDVASERYGLTRCDAVRQAVQQWVAREAVHEAAFRALQVQEAAQQ